MICGTASERSSSCTDEMVQDIARKAFDQLRESNFDFDETPTKRAHELRLDIRPKSMVLVLCKELQRVATEEAVPNREDTDVNDPYDGPIRMTRSVSKCAFVLNAVFDHLDEGVSRQSTNLLLLGFIISRGAERHHPKT